MFNELIHFQILYLHIYNFFSLHIQNHEQKHEKKDLKNPIFYASLPVISQQAFKVPKFTNISTFPSAREHPIYTYAYYLQALEARAYYRQSAGTYRRKQSPPLARRLSSIRRPTREAIVALSSRTLFSLSLPDIFCCPLRASRKVLFHAGKFR